MSLAEAIARSITCWLALTAIAAYAIDAAGFGVRPWASVGVALLLTRGAAIRRPRPVGPQAADLYAWLGIVVFLIAMFLRMSWPSLVPPSRGPDLTHHLLLVDYIEQSGHLVHDRALDGSMGEMAHYTPASHLLAVIAGAVFGADGLRAFFPLTAVCAALTAGWTFLIARRAGILLPYAIVSVSLLFFAAQYFFGAFTHDGFLSQTVSTLFAVATWWAIAEWDDRPTIEGAIVIAVFVVATFLSWPIWIGPPLVVFLAVLMKAELPHRDRATELAIVLVPLLAIFLLHSWNRWGWLAIVRTSGAVLHPSLDSLGWFMPLLAMAGLVLAGPDRHARVTIVMLTVIVLQGITLLTIAKANGADTPYMAFKMVYLAIYPLAVLAAYAIARSMPRSAQEPLGWLLAAVFLLGAVRPALAAPREIPVVDLDLQAAGQWLRANGGATCADYLVADAEAAYWLHLAVLGNPRSGPRMAELDRYDARAAIAPWITAEGRTYAIADLRLLPDEVRSRVQIVKEVGHGAVIRRQGATMKGCD
ncbi:MAG: hypothetical protein K2Y23_02440 [Cyanobacteria bacterium]|nr:hypothetical protein [Cyanobacteriota bacterium]